MASWREQNREVLLRQAREYEVVTDETDTLRKLKKKIAEAAEFYEKEANEFADKQLEEIVAEAAKTAKEREIAANELESQHNYELEKIRLTNAGESTSVRSGSGISSTDQRKPVRLRDLPKFEARETDITLYFTLFERQAKRYGIEEDEYVSQLIPLLPRSMQDLIIREPSKMADDYNRVKNLLSIRFWISSAALRAKFEEHQKKPGYLWTDLVYDLRSYLSQYLESLEITSFESLLERLILEQIQKRVPWDTRALFAERWEDFSDAVDLVEKLGAYETTKHTLKKSEPRMGDRRVGFRGKEYFDRGRDRAEKGAGASEKNSLKKPSQHPLSETLLYLKKK